MDVLPFRLRLIDDRFFIEVNGVAVLREMLCFRQFPADNDVGIVGKDLLDEVRILEVVGGTIIFEEIQQHDARPVVPFH